MARTFVHDFTRDDGEAVVCAEYTFRAGAPAQSYGPAEDCYPAEADEIEVLKVTDAAGEAVVLTTAEDARLDIEISDNPPEDDGPDPDEWRDAMRDDGFF